MGLLSDIGNRYKEEKITLENKTQDQSNLNKSNASESELLKEYKTERGSKLYDPYEGLSGALRSSKGGFRLPEQPEFVFIEQAKQKRRSWSENLCYYTGIGYGLGALAGGCYGITQMSIKNPDVAIDNARMKINRFLNTTGRTGRSFGNAFGVLGLFFAAFESGFNYLIEDYVPSGIATISAGFATGAIFRSSRGLRPATLAGGVGAVSATILLLGRKFIKGL